MQNKSIFIYLRVREGWTALMFASFNGDYHVAKILLEHGAKVNEKNKYLLTFTLVMVRLR